MRGTLAALALQHPRELAAPDALKESEVRQVLDHLAPYLRRGDVFALSWAAYLTAAVGCGRRGASLRGDDLRWRQVTRSGGQLHLFLPWDKTHKKDLNRARDTVVVPAPTDPALNALAAVERYAAAVGAVLGSGDEAVFPRRHRSGLVASVHFSSSACSRDFRKLMADRGGWKVLEQEQPPRVRDRVARCAPGRCGHDGGGRLGHQDGDAAVRRGRPVSRVDPRAWRALIYMGYLLYGNEPLGGRGGVSSP